MRIPVWTTYKSALLVLWPPVGVMLVFALWPYLWPSGVSGQFDRSRLHITHLSCTGHFTQVLQGNQDLRESVGLPDTGEWKDEVVLAGTYPSKTVPYPAYYETDFVVEGQPKGTRCLYPSMPQSTVPVFEVAKWRATGYIPSFLYRYAGWFEWVCLYSLIVVAPALFVVTVLTAAARLIYRRSLRTRLVGDS